MNAPLPCSRCSFAGRCSRGVVRAVGAVRGVPGVLFVVFVMFALFGRACSTTCMGLRLRNAEGLDRA